MSSNSEQKMPASKNPEEKGEENDQNAAAGVGSNGEHLSIEQEVPAVTKSKKLAIAPGLSYSDAIDGREACDHAEGKSPLEIAPGRPYTTSQEERGDFVDSELGASLEGETEDLGHQLPEALVTGGARPVSNPATTSEQEQAPGSGQPLVSAVPVRQMALVAASPVLYEEELETPPNCWTRHRTRYLVLASFLFLVPVLVIALIFLTRPSSTKDSPPPSFPPSPPPSFPPSPSLQPFDESRNRIEMNLLGIELRSVDLAQWNIATSEHVKMYWNTLESLGVSVGEVVTDSYGLVELVPRNSMRGRRRLLAPVLQFQYRQNITFGVEEGKSGPETPDSLFTRPFLFEAQPYLDVIRNLTGTQGDVEFGSIRVRDFEPVPTPAPAPASNPISSGAIVGLTLGIIAGIAVLLFVVVWRFTRQPHEPSFAEYDANQASFDSGGAGPVVDAPPAYGVSDSDYKEYSYSRSSDVPSSVYENPPQSISTPASMLNTAGVDQMASTSDAEMPDVQNGSTAE